VFIVFLPQVIKLLVICSPEPYHTYDVDRQALGTKVHQYFQGKYPRNGEFLYIGLPSKSSSRVPYKMRDYRKIAATNNEEVEDPLIPDSRTYSEGIGEAYMELAAQYGLPNDMIIGNPCETQQQTVDQEYQAYVTAPCSPKDVKPLKFWEVRGDINGARTY
jgi:hypothetical protein